MCPCLLQNFQDQLGPAGPCAFFSPAKVTSELLVTLGRFVNPSGQMSCCQDTHFSWDITIHTFPWASRGPRVSR